MPARLSAGHGSRLGRVRLFAGPWRLSKGPWSFWRIFPTEQRKVARFPCITIAVMFALSDPVYGAESAPGACSAGAMSLSR